MKRVIMSAIAGVFVWGAVGDAHASPWTLPQHELVLSTSFGFSAADHEYLRGGKLQAYPLGGRFLSSSLTLGARYGFTDDFEMEVRPIFKQVSYEADSVILDIAGDSFDLASARASVIDFDSNRFGAADLDAVARYNLLRGAVMVTPEVGIKIPLGYDAPQGTFEDVATFSVADDVALGDGQIDAHLALLVGSYLPWTRTFVRMDAAFVHRFGAPGDQVRLNGKIGQFLTESFIVFGGVRWARTITEGDPIGDTFVDTRPGEQGAEDFRFEFVDVQPLYLDRDFLIAEVGAILDVGEHVELQASWEETLDGDNYADLRSVNVAVVVAIPNATRQREDTPAQASPVEEEVIEEVIVVPAEGDGEVVEEVIIEEVEPSEDDPAEDDPAEDDPAEDDPAEDEPEAVSPSGDEEGGGEGGESSEGEGAPPARD